MRLYEIVDEPKFRIAQLFSARFVSIFQTECYN
jgi:hypothetical protein